MSCAVAYGGCCSISLNDLPIVVLTGGSAGILSAFRMALRRWASAFSEFISGLVITPAVPSVVWWSEDGGGPYVCLVSALLLQSALASMLTRTTLVRSTMRARGTHPWIPAGICTCKVRTRHSPGGHVPWTRSPMTTCGCHLMTTHGCHLVVWGHCACSLCSPAYLMQICHATIAPGGQYASTCRRHTIRQRKQYLWHANVAYYD